jgi:hypothetical protein
MSGSTRRCSTSRAVASCGSSSGSMVT